MCCSEGSKFKISVLQVVHLSEDLSSVNKSYLFFLFELKATRYVTCVCMTRSDLI